MESIIPILNALNASTPIGVIALLAVIIYLLLKGKVGGIHKEVSTIRDNHLHEVSDTLRNIEASLRRIEIKMSEDFAHIKARINGGSQKQ